MKKHAKKPSPLARLSKGERRRRAVTPEDLSRFRIVSDPQIAPDGSQIVFVEKHVTAENIYATNLWMVDVAKDSPHPATCRYPSPGGGGENFSSPPATRIGLRAGRPTAPDCLHPGLEKTRACKSI